MIIKTQDENVSNAVLELARVSTLETGGCSVAIATTPEGFAVGRGPLGETFPVSILENDIKFWETVADFVKRTFTLERKLSVQGKDFDGFGLWKGDDGKLYIDPIYFVTSRNAAFELARLYGEQAIFELSSSTTWMVD